MPTLKEQEPLRTASDRAGGKDLRPPGRCRPHRRGVPAAIRSWRRTGLPSFLARLSIRSWRTCSTCCRSRLSMHPKSRCSRSRSRLIGRCAAPSTSRLRCTGHRIAQAPGAGRRRHSFAPSFGLARSSTSSTNTSAGIRSGSAGSSGMSRLGTSPAWSGTSAKGGEHGSETPYRPDAHG
jgi:hypothetical protein